MDLKNDYLQKVRAIEEAAKKSKTNARTDATNAAPSTSTGSNDFIIPEIKVPIELPTGDRAQFSLHWVDYINQTGGVMKSPAYVQIDRSRFEVYLDKENVGDGWIRKDLAYYINELHKKVAPKLGVKKLTITSNYRQYPEYNATIEGAAGRSPHIAGLAVDIGATGDDRFIIADEAWNMNFGGIAIGNGFTHVDIGPRAFWGYEDNGNYIYRGPGSH